MRIIGHGIDVESIQRVKLEIESSAGNWISAFCSKHEIDAADALPTQFRYYAGRYAAKEAVVKALGTGYSGNITWHGIEILRDETGAPSVRLSHEVEEYAMKLGITTWHISISYSGDIAIASAIATGESVFRLE